MWRAQKNVLSLRSCACVFVFGNCRVRRIHTVICRRGILCVHVYVCSLVGYMCVCACICMNIFLLEGGRECVHCILSLWSKILLSSYSLEALICAWLCTTLSYSSYECISGVNVQLTVLCFFFSLVFLVVNRIAQCLIFANNSWRAIVSVPILVLASAVCLVLVQCP